MRHRLLVAMLFSAARLDAQVWDTESARSLVDRAILVRARAEQDSTLSSYRASARGVVTFLARVGLGSLGSDRVLKGDQLSVEVYWQRPGRSKQIIRGWRDSTYFPTEIRYHRDHLGIVTNDFGPTIRIGEGDEVVDVVHPLAPGAGSRYQYAIRDTLVIATPTGRLRLVAIEARPRDPNDPGVVGTLFLDVDRALLVRSEFTFTKSAYRDKSLQDITVRLERSLVEGRYWLPFRQEIEIRRKLAVLDFPLEGVIRGRWEIDDYDLTVAVPDSVWSLPAIAGPTHPIGGGDWREFPTLALAIDSANLSRERAALAEVRARATRLASRKLLDGLGGTRLELGRVSDLAHWNRVQGLALGIGVRSRALPAVDRARAAVGLGLSDHRVTGSVGFGWDLGQVSLDLAAARQVADLSEVEIASGVARSIAAQELGHDWGDYVLLESVGAGLGVPAGRGRASLELAREWAWSVAASQRPATGDQRPNPGLGSDPYWVVRAGWSGSERSERRAWDGAIRAEWGIGASGYLRLFATVGRSQPVPGGELSLRGLGVFGTDQLPARRSIPLGGTGTLHGEPFRAYGGRSAAYARIDWLLRLPGPGFSLGSFGRVPSETWFGPVVAAGWAGGAMTGVPWVPSQGIRPVAGLALELFARTLRFEVGHALRGSHGIGFSIDVSRVWWPLL